MITVSDTPSGRIVFYTFLRSNQINATDVEITVTPTFALPTAHEAAARVDR